MALKPSSPAALMHECLLIDIGNSALKFATYQTANRDFCSQPLRLQWSKSQSQLECPELLMAAKRSDSILISSVNRPHCQTLCEYVASVTAVSPQIVDYHLIPLKLAVDAPDRVGIDRLLAAYAAWSMFGKSKPLIVLQVGTAVTIDLMDKQGIYQGGVILPSETTLYSSLAEKTDRLPKIEVDAKHFDIDLVQPGELVKLPSRSLRGPTNLPPGKNTIDAMRLGVSHCMRGGVDWTYRKYCEQFGADLPVVATGGGATELVIDDMPVTLVSNLVLKGLSLLCK